MAFLSLDLFLFLFAIIFKFAYTYITERMYIRIVEDSSFNGGEGR